MLKANLSIKYVRFILYDYTLDFIVKVEESLTNENPAA